MSDREAGFLWENERRYIDGVDREGTEPRKIKSQLKNTSASATTVGNTLRTYRRDLERVERFWQEQMADEGGKYYLDDVILPANEDEIRKLHTLLENWLERAEHDFAEQEDEILAAHLYPLWQDLDIDGETHPVRHLFGERDDGEPDSERTPRAELIARREALICLLEDPQLREILMWVDEHPNRKIPKDKKQNGKGKRWEASRWLRSEYGLVEEAGGFDHVYSLTRRGETVRDALSELSTSEVQEVADLDTEETFRTWLRFLNRREALTE